MAKQYAVYDATYEAAADLSTHQYKIVELTALNTVGLCNAASDVPFGILQNKPAAAGRAAIVRRLGLSKVKVNAAGLAINTNWGTDANGRAIAKTADGDYVGGRCEEAAGATVDLIATVSVNTLSPHRLRVP